MEILDAPKRTPEENAYISTLIGHHKLSTDTESSTNVEPEKLTQPENLVNVKSPLLSAIKRGATLRKTSQLPQTLNLQETQISESASGGYRKNFQKKSQKKSQNNSKLKTKSKKTHKH
jgi:hypothetical protein